MTAFRNPFQLLKEIRQDTQLQPLTRLLFTVRGRMELTIGQKCLTLMPEDFAVLNPGDFCSVHTADKTVAAVLTFDPVRFPELESAPGPIRCFSSEADSPYRETICETVRKIIWSEVMQPHQTGAGLMSLMYKLLDLLLEHFCCTGTAGTGLQNSSDRLRRILQYINMHFREDVSLSEPADELYISPSTVSRLFQTM